MLTPLLEVLTRITADSGRTWTAEAYTAVLTAYNVAKMQAKTNGKNEQAIAPLTEHLARGKRRKPA